MKLFNLRLVLGILTLLLGAIATNATDLPRFLHIKDQGDLLFDTRYDLIISRFIPPDWKSDSQKKLQINSGFPKRSNSDFEVEGDFSGFQLKETITSTGRNKLKWSAQLKALKDPVPCNMLFAGMKLLYQEGVSLAVNGKKITMSPSVSKKNAFAGSAQTVEITDRFGNLTIRGDFTAHVTGNFVDASNGKNYYHLRLMPKEKVPKEVDEWKLELEIEGDFSRIDVKSEQLDLASVFNRALRDEVANDGKGGWTDQGPTMDLRSLKPGDYDFNNVKLKVKDGDQACLVLSEGQSAQLPVAPKSNNGTHLYLFHASAWTPMFPQLVGTLEVSYADGTREEFSVAGGRDCGNWNNPVELSNAHVAWKSEKSPFGLYLSGFPLKSKPVQLKFTGQKGMWMIVGAALTNGRVRFPLKEEFVVKSGPNWLPIHFEGKTVAGSPLDFSGFRELEAGKDGHIIASKTGHLVFENAPDKRIRLFGPNLVGGANYLDRKLADDFVEKAERLGYNTIRFHHFENGLLDSKALDSLTINPAKLDMLQYLFARLKERGFYMCIDLYASRTLKPGDNIPEFDNTGEFSMKNLVYVSPAAMENWKEFARRVLTVKNPYTGMSMAEDPGLYALNLINENSIMDAWNSSRTSRRASEIISKRFEEYLKSPDAPKIDSTHTKNGIFIDFLLKLQAKGIAEQTRFLKDEIKLKALITDVNFYRIFTLTPIRANLELVDNHQYWDHPRFPAKRWDYPFCFKNESSIKLEGACPRMLMPTRIFGKPFTVTEFNFCVPNTYRVECPSVFGGYAALQDWDGLYRFAWSHGNAGMKDPNRILHRFDTVNNIQAQMAERIIYLLFVRGDVRPAEPAIAFAYKPEQTFRIERTPKVGDYPEAFSRLGLWGRIGSLPAERKCDGVIQVDPFEQNWEKALPQGANEAMKSLADTGVASSSTGELTLDKKKNQLLITTARSEVVTGSGSGVCKVMRLDKMSCYQTVALQSLDGKPLVESEKILLSQLTDVSNDQLRYDDDSRQVLRDWGKLPHMLERGSAEVQLALPKRLKVVPLQLDGTPVADKEVSTTYQDGILAFRIATDLLEGGTLSYVLTPAE